MCNTSRIFSLHQKHCFVSLTDCWTTYSRSVLLLCKITKIQPDRKMVLFRQLCLSNYSADVCGLFVLGLFSSMFWDERTKIMRFEVLCQCVLICTGKVLECWFVFLLQQTEYSLHPDRTACFGFLPSFHFKAQKFVRNFSPAQLLRPPRCNNLDDQFAVEYSISVLPPCLLRQLRLISIRKGRRCQRIKTENSFGKNIQDLAALLLLCWYFVVQCGVSMDMIRMYF